MMLVMLAIVCCHAAARANDADDALCFRLFAMRQPEPMMPMMLPIVSRHAAAGANDADDASYSLLCFGPPVAKMPMMFPSFRHAAFQ